MKIVHIAPSAPYNEGWGYQENLLPKYHKKLGHDVTLIVSTFSHDKGAIVDVGEEDYVNADGVRVIRRAYKNYATRALTNMHAQINAYPLLKEIAPDFIFFHGLQGTTIYQAIRYKKKDNPNCIIVRDNHLDYNIGTRCTRFKDKLIRAFHRRHIRRTLKYVDKVYGVTPWRKTYAEDYFSVPSSKTDVLIMGADDEKINFSSRESIRLKIREKYGIKEDDFLIVTGGKLDKKKKVDVLMEGCKNLAGVKLLVFGSLLDEERQSFESLLSSADNITYIGWVAADSVYDYFFAADLVAFPGQHSVLWEQACASKTPCAFARWEGMDHVDNGGNSSFVDENTPQGWREEIIRLCGTQAYAQMLQTARSEKTDVYLYSNIAKKSLQNV